MGSREVNMFNVIKLKLKTGSPVMAKVINDEAGDTPRRNGDTFRIAKIKRTFELDPEEFQVFCPEGWAYLLEELEITA